VARGRKPKPTALKLLGGAQPCRVNAEEPAPPATLPEPPGHLSEVALAEWRRIVPQLDAMGVITAVDGAALSIYCMTFARWLDALAAVAEFGLFIDTRIVRTAGPDGAVLETVNDKGCVKSNPAVAVAAGCEAAMARLLGEFGLTPASRSKVKATGRPVENKLAKFLLKSNPG
jgi:P27 family predicted phage terminase small subunit